MPRHGPYGDSRNAGSSRCRPYRGGPMHPDILQSLAAERVRDMRKRSTTAGLRRLARRSRAAASAAPRPTPSGGQPALETLPERSPLPGRPEPGSGRGSVRLDGQPGLPDRPAGRKPACPAGGLDPPASEDPAVRLQTTGLAWPQTRRPGRPAGRKPADPAAGARAKQEPMLHQLARSPRTCPAGPIRNFFAERPEDVERGKAMCRGCPLRSQLPGRRAAARPSRSASGAANCCCAAVVIPSSDPRGRPRRARWPPEPAPGDLAALAAAGS